MKLTRKQNELLIAIIESTIERKIIFDVVGRGLNIVAGNLVKKGLIKIDYRDTGTFATYIQDNGKIVIITDKKKYHKNEKKKLS